MWASCIVFYAEPAISRKSLFFNLIQRPCGDLAEVTHPRVICRFSICFRP